MRQKKKKEYMIKRVYNMDTYLLYSKGDIFIYAVIAHKGASREAIEIAKQILSENRYADYAKAIISYV